MRAILPFLRNEDGPTVVEYAVMIACIIAVCVISISAVGGQSGFFWVTNQQRLDNAIQSTQGS